MTPVPRRFLVGFFASFLVLGVVMLVRGDVKARVPETPPVVEISAATLARQVIEKKPGLLVVDLSKDGTKLPGVRAAADGNCVEAVEAVRGTDRKGVLVLVADASTALEPHENALRAKGFTVQRLKGGAEAWKAEVMESTNAEMAAAAAFFRGELTPAAVDAKPAQPVIVRPRKSSGGGGSGC